MTSIILGFYSLNSPQGQKLKTTYREMVCNFNFLNLPCLLNDDVINERKLMGAFTH